MGEEAPIDTERGSVVRNKDDIAVVHPVLVILHDAGREIHLEVRSSRIKFSVCHLLMRNGHTVPSRRAE